MQACPQFADMARSLCGYLKNWNDVHRAASQLRAVVGISEDAWNVAQRTLGSEIAAAAIALIYDKHAAGEVSSPGAAILGAWSRRPRQGSCISNAVSMAGCQGRRPKMGGIHQINWTFTPERPYIVKRWQNAT